MGLVQENIIEIETDLERTNGVVDNLLDEQSLQDERILTLEQTSDSLALNVFQLQQDVQGTRTTKGVSFVS